MAYRAAVVGGSGYTGAELLRLLAAHPEIEVVHVTADSNAGAAVGDLYPSLAAAYPAFEYASYAPADLAGVDVAFVALHGRDGEDGTVQELLELLGVPYTASGVSACIRCMDKVLAKHLMRDTGIPTPDFYAFNETAFKELGAAQALPAIEERLDFPIVVKPAGQGSALGIKFARTPADVPTALVAAFSYDRKVLLERAGLRLEGTLLDELLAPTAARDDKARVFQDAQVFHHSEPSHLQFGLEIT